MRRTAINYTDLKLCPHRPHMSQCWVRMERTAINYTDLRLCTHRPHISLCWVRMERTAINYTDLRLCPHRPHMSQCWGRMERTGWRWPAGWSNVDRSQPPYCQPIITILSQIERIKWTDARQKQNDWIMFINIHILSSLYFVRNLWQSLCCSKEICNTCLSYKSVLLTNLKKSTIHVLVTNLCCSQI